MGSQEAYESGDLGKSRLGTDQTHFYIMGTYLLGTDVIARIGKKDLIARLEKLAKIMDNPLLAPANSALRTTITSYLQLSAKQATDVSRRKDRLKQFATAIELVNRAPTMSKRLQKRKGDVDAEASLPPRQHSDPPTSEE